MLTPPLPRHHQRADWELHATLTLGELCRQFQNKLYKIIFPNSFQSNRNYKMKNIWRDLDRLPQLWNVDAHPAPLTEEGLARAAEVMDSKGNLKGWLSLKRVNELITMWKNVQTMEWVICLCFIGIAEIVLKSNLAALLPRKDNRNLWLHSKLLSMRLSYS